MRDRKFAITSALNIAAHTEGATPNNRVTCGLVNVPRHFSILFADSLQQGGQWCGVRGWDHGSLISVETSLDEGRGQGWRTPSEVVAGSGKREP